MPDFYQGTELWDLSLVDPDNRRPVDFERSTANAGRGRSPARAGCPSARGGHRGAAQDVAGRLGSSCSSRPPDCGSVASGPICSCPAGTYRSSRKPTVGASMVAFARMHGDAVGALRGAAIQRFSDRRPAPYAHRRRALEDDACAVTRLELTDRSFRNVLTGAEVRPVVTDSQAWMFAGQLFETVPVAILTGS